MVRRPGFGRFRLWTILLALGLTAAGVSPVESQRTDSLARAAGAAGVDSTYANDRVRGAVEQAAAVHARPPDALASFGSDTESGGWNRRSDR
ncbi:MAG: hypothetical protein PVH00_04185 [Gemmatimonadota bacterium]